MAARRLVVVMLVLLAISTLATALLPRPDGGGSNPPSTTTTREPPTTTVPAADRGLLLVAEMQVPGAPQTLRLERGDQLRLDVEAQFGADVEIPGFGLIEPVTPFAPAHFDLLADSRGTFPVRVVDPAQLVGRILVGRPGSGRCGVSTPAAPQGRESTPSCDHRGTRSSRHRGRSGRRP